MADPPLLRYASVSAEINLSRKNYQSLELKDSSKTNAGAINTADCPGAGDIVDRIPNTEKKSMYEQENLKVVCGYVNSHVVSIGAHLHEPDRTSSRNGGDCGATAKLKVRSGGRDNGSSVGVRGGYYIPL